MAEVSVPSLIIFIASIVVAAGVAGVLVNTVSGIGNALDDRGVDVARDVRTDTEIISDSGADVYDETDGNGTLTLLVKNTGRRTLPADARAYDVIVDSRYRTNVSVVNVYGGTADEWGPSRVVEIRVGDLALDAGDHRVKFVIDGDEEVFRFNT